jgi:hypothetical protein
VTRHPAVPCWSARSNVNLTAGAAELWTRPVRVIPGEVEIPPDELEVLRLWNVARAEPSVFAREIQQFLNAGYSWAADYLVPK